jgi:hypothetical protein
MYRGDLQARRHDWMGITLAAVLLREKVAIPVSTILQEFQSRYPELQASLASAEDGTASFELVFGEAIIADMGAPLPWSDLEGPCATSLLWAGAAAEVGQHQSHLVVTILSEVAPVEAATQFTKVTATILSAFEHAIGVLWFDAALLVPKALFLDMCETVVTYEAPIDIWVDFRVGRDGDNQSTGFTQGVAALGLMELEARKVPETPGDLRSRLQNLARYLVQNGPVIADGHSVGYDAEERIRVVYGSSGFGAEGQVMQLQYETPKKRWPWQR